MTSLKYKNMKKIILGTVAGIAAGYYFRKMQERVNFKEMCDDINGIGYKTKKKMKNMINKGMNEADCIKDQIENKITN